MHAFPNTHGVSMYCPSRFTASTAEALAVEMNMGRRPSLSTNDRYQALRMLRAGRSSRQVAAVFGVAQSNMSRLLQPFNATQSVNDRRRSGCPRTMTRQQDNYIRNITLSNRQITARALQHQLRTATSVNICNQTVRNRLRAGNLRSRRPAAEQH